MEVISIQIDSCNVLTFNGDRLATVQEYLLTDRCIDSIFVLLCPSQWVRLAEGIFQLNQNLDLYLSVNSNPQAWALKAK